MAIERVTFDAAGHQLAGHLFLPKGGDRGTRRPGVAVAGSWTTVKEQMAARYARRLADEGFVALTFDFRGFGESGGTPRDVESPSGKAQDLRAAARFLATLPQVEPEQIGILAVCASAGYAAVATSEDDAVRSLVMVAPWLHDREIVAAIYGGEEGVAQRREAARAARERFERSGEVEYVKAASNTDPTAAMYWEGDFLDYYLNPSRGKVPQWSGRFAVMAWEEWLTFDPIALAPRVRPPTRIVTGPGTATPGGAERFARAMTAPHDVVSLEGTQFHFYDDDPTVARASAAAVEHFRATSSRR